MYLVQKLFLQKFIYAVSQKRTKFEMYSIQLKIRRIDFVDI